MRPWVNSTVLQVIDSIAICIAQGYMLTRARLASHPSPVVRLAAARDNAVWDARLLERELAVFRQERQRPRAKQRSHYTPAHRLEILQIMRLRDWSTAQTARRFVLHPNTVRGWVKQLQSDGESSRLFTGPVWNRIHDSVRWTVHELRRLCPEPDCGTRTIARDIVRGAIEISRSSVQRVLREQPPRRHYNKPAMVPPAGTEPHHLLTPRATNQVWQLDMMQLRILWFRFTIAALLDGCSRKLLRLQVFTGTPTTADMLRLVRSAIKSFGQPRCIITDHGGQFMGTFTAKLEHIGITVVQGKVRQPSFNGKVERFFRTLRIWSRIAVLPISLRPLQRRLDRYRIWYNEHRPHASIGGRTPDEAWNGIELAVPISIRAADPDEIVVSVDRQSYRDDRALPIVTIRVDRKEAA